MSQGWSSDAPDGALLYEVYGIIDTWSLKKATKYADQGYVHYHEFRRVSDGEHHPTKVIWYKHVAVTTFTLDRGPAYWQGNPNPPYTHGVVPGIDYLFPNNYLTPYP
jgi:selenium-binding protein 1